MRIRCKTSLRPANGGALQTCGNKKPFFFFAAAATFLAGANSHAELWAAPANLKPIVVVETSYPGANAAVVRDTVAAPIEEQVNGVEGMLHICSRSTDAGAYTLTVIFKPGTDLNVAQGLVQNRVALALPVLPDLVQKTGVTVKKVSPYSLLLVDLTSPENRYDAMFLRNYADIHVKDELGRLPGVGGVTCFGSAGVVRIKLDLEKLAARGLAASEVADAISQQNLAVGIIGQPPKPKDKDAEIRLLPGRLIDAAAIEGIIVKTMPDGSVVRLKDIARLEFGASEQGHTSFNGKPAVCMEIQPMVGVSPKQLGAAVQDAVAKLRRNLPDGLAINVDFDFSENLEAASQTPVPEYLLLDIQLPAGASQERIVTVQQRCGKLLGSIDGVRDVLELPDEPFELGVERPCILVRLDPSNGRKASREQVTRTLRDRLTAEISDAMLRLRDLSRPGSFPRCAYPIDLALSGPEPDELQKWADRVVDRLRASKKLTDLAIDADAVATPQLFVDVDRAKCASLGVKSKDVFSTLQVYLGSQYVGDFNRFGRTWQVSIQTDARIRDKAADLKQLQVRGANGNMIALGSIATIRDSDGPTAIKRLDMRQIVEITANPATGVSLGESRELCEKLAGELRPESKLPAEYRLHWMQDISAGK